MGIERPGLSLGCNTADLSPSAGRHHTHDSETVESSKVNQEVLTAC